MSNDNFPAGMRVRPSRLLLDDWGGTRVQPPTAGTVQPRKSSRVGRDVVLVLWDGRAQRTQLHEKFIERLPEEADVDLTDPSH